MKLLIDGRPVREPISGTAKFIIELHTHLKALKTDHSVYVQTDNGKNTKIKLIDKESIIQYHGNAILRNLRWEFMPALDQPKLNFDLIHETYFANLNFKARYKIATIHDIIPLDYPEWFTPRLSGVLRRNFKRQTDTCDRIVFSSHYTKNRAIDHGFNGQANVVHLAAEKAKFISSDRNLLKNIDERLLNEDYVTILGNIEPRKSHLELAAAIKKLNIKTGKNIHLLVVGSGVHKTSKIIKDVKSILNNNVIFAGFVDSETKQIILKNTACHAYISKYEGFGLPLVESIIDDIPSIFYNKTSLMELIPNKGLLVDSLDVDILSKKINDNLYLKPSDIIGKSELESFAEYFSWRRVAQEYQEVYDNV
jgi:glycosyltransferase involved in cell wall biosynthesis